MNWLLIYLSSNFATHHGVQARHPRHRAHAAGHAAAGGATRRLAPDGGTLRLGRAERRDAGGGGRPPLPGPPPGAGALQRALQGHAGKRCVGLKRRSRLYMFRYHEIRCYNA